MALSPAAESYEYDFQLRRSHLRLRESRGRQHWRLPPEAALQTDTRLAPTARQEAHEQFETGLKCRHRGRVDLRRGEPRARGRNSRCSLVIQPRRIHE